MAHNPTPSAAGGSGSRNDASAAAIAAKKEKRAAVAAAAMAPRMQSQVQKWAKMTAELGGSGGHDGTAGGVTDDDYDNDDETTRDAGRPRKKARTAGTTTDRKAKRAKRRAQDALPYAKQLRAPHRRDRYVSFGIGTGLGRKPTGDKAAVTKATSSLPPTCLLCLVRFESRQQLRDHESLSSRHKRQLRNPAARKIAIQRYSKIAEDEAAAAAAAQPDTTKDDTGMTDQKDDNNDTPRTVHRPPVHIKRLPRRRGDLAPTYTSYAVPARATKPREEAEGTDAGDGSYHACLLCRRRFRSRAMLRLHERESALHRARTRDPASVAAAVDAVNKAVADEAEAKGEVDDAGKTAQPPTRPLLRMRPAAPSTAGTAAAQYRDRARERRIVFGDGNRGRGTPKKSGRKDAASTPAAVPSKGATLLSKMGWTAGQGLGVQGGGVKEAIAPAVYRSGVGLGAQGGKLGDAADVAARRTESSYADFVQQTRDTARQRLMALDRQEAEAAEAAAAAAAAAAAKAAFEEEEAAQGADETLVKPEHN